MRFILRKFVDAESVKEAVSMDRKTPVHDCYLKDGEEPNRPSEKKDLIGFIHPEEPSFGWIGEPQNKKR